MKPSRRIGASWTRWSCFFITFISLIGGAATESPADIAVWVEFDGGWETELAAAASSAGVTAFSGAEVDAIEVAVVEELMRIYDGYEITFVPSAVEPSFDMHIDYGATTGGSDQGLAPIIFGLSETHFEKDLASPPDAPHASKVFTGNFDLYVDEFSGSTDRASPIDQLTIALARIGAHELGHSVGLLHHHVYGNAGISPDTYAGTGGLQESALMATGSSISGGVPGFESVTESPADLGKWERALLDTTGGSIITAGMGTGASVVAAPVVSECELDDCAFPPTGDVGETAGGAQLLTKSLGETSGLDMWYVTGFLHTAGDIDLYAIEIDDLGTLTIDLWSEFAFVPPADMEVILFDTDGTTPMFGNDDATYEDDAFDLGKEGSPGVTFGSKNAFISNFEITTPGTYYIAAKESPVSGPSMHPYALIVGFEPVPEPSSIVMLLIGSIGIATRYRRRQRTA